MKSRAPVIFAVAASCLVIIFCRMIVQGHNKNKSKIILETGDNNEVQSETRFTDKRHSKIVPYHWEIVKYSLDHNHSGYVIYKDTKTDIRYLYVMYSFRNGAMTRIWEKEE